MKEHIIYQKLYGTILMSSFIFQVRKCILINREVIVRKEREGKGIVFVFHKWNRYYLTHIPSMILICMLSLSINIYLIVLIVYKSQNTNIYNNLLIFMILTILIKLKL